VSKKLTVLVATSRTDFRELRNDEVRQKAPSAGLWPTINGAIA
jgi:hypothetical protein